MNKKKDIIDMYYKNIEEQFNCKTLDELLGKKYIIENKFGVGGFSRIKVEEGLEVSKLEINKANHHVDNRGYDGDMLEVGYCYSGNVEILSLPNKKEYTIKAGDSFIYKVLNDVEYFKCTYNECKTISINMDLNIIKDVINPALKYKVIEDWQNNINDIFKEDILIIEKASYKTRKIAENIDSIPIDSIVSYMKLKVKIMELLDNFFQEKSNKKFSQNIRKQEEKIVIKAEKIITKNFEKQLSVTEIASDLKISTYKLQEAFKNIKDITVYEYIKKVRIKKAEYLLKNTKMSIIEIANEVGYENPSKFSSLFKSYHNITPLKYRKLYIMKLQT